MKNEIETKFTELMNKFKHEASQVISESVSDLHSEYLPFVIEDTELNFQLRINDCLELIARGQFTTSEDELSLTVIVGDLGHKVTITSSLWDSARDSLASAVSDKAKDLKIKSLQDEIKFMQEGGY